MPTLRYVGNAGRYRLTNSDVDVAQGETVTVDEDTAAHLQEHGEFETVGQENGSPDPDTVDGESGTLPFSPEEHTIDEIADKVADIDEPAALRALLNLEAEQNDRNGAADAIKSRLDELED